MNRIALGAVGAMLLASAGMFWWQGRAEVERGAPPPDISGSAAPGEDVVLPTAGPHARGAAPPGASRARPSREAQRFARYDRNRNGQIERVELLAPRVKAFRKLDTNHDNLLSFEEWAVKTSDRFRQIDRNGDGLVNRAELDAWYAARDAKRSNRPKCSCDRNAAGQGTHPPRTPPAPSDDDGDPVDER